MRKKEGTTDQKWPTVQHETYKWTFSGAFKQIPEKKPGGAT